MAKPTDPIYVWAREDVNLPSTGLPNKSKPIDDLLDKGYDKGQKPAAEEFNYILNMSSGWIDWIVNEKFPELEAEIARLLQELEERINRELELIRDDIAKVREELADLKVYVDQKVSELKLEIQGVRNDLSALREDMNEAFTEVNNRIDALEPLLVPIGAIIPWPSAVAPDGWLECNGQIYNTGQNPKLFAVLGRNSVPDYRGIFLRGWAHGSNVYDPDAGRAIGSFQDDAMRQITGGHVSASRWRAGDGIYGAFRREGRRWNTNYKNGGGDDWGDYVSFDNGRVTPIAVENRSKNIAVMYIIKTDKSQSSGTTSPTGITITPNSIAEQIGYTVKATASVQPASIAGQYPVSWSTQDPTVATVDGSGNIRLVGAGTTNIVASISTGMSVMISVTSYALLTAVSIVDPGEVQVGASKELALTKTPSNANEPLQWLTNNTGVATVDSSGVLRGITIGTARITVRGTLSGVTSFIDVTIIPEELDEIVQDNRLGALGTYVPSDPEDSWTFQAPQGCALTGLKNTATFDITGVYYKPIQKKVNGVWVTIAG